jgi:hypothetical protein
MYVDVLSATNYPIGGMTADSFCVSEDGVNIPSFTVQQLQLDSCVTSIALVVDVSGSMLGAKLDSAKSAMHRFVNNMDTFDRVAIVPYSTCIGTVTPFTSNKTTLHNAINALAAEGWTACYDGIYKGVDLTKLELGSKAVIAFTDGLENRSPYCSQPPDGVNDNSYADDSTLICNLANGAGIPIYTFNLGTIEYTWYNPIALQAFSAATGGAWDSAPTGAEIDLLYSKIKARLCSRYYICYNSIDTVQNGDIHASTVCYKHGGLCTPCDTASCQEAASPVPHRTPTTVHLSDTCQSAMSNINIGVYVFDKDTPVNDLTVRLFYKFNADPSYTSVDMTHSSGDSLFSYVIPVDSLSCKSGIDYYITASDGQHNVSDPANNPQTSPYVIQICPNQPPPVANAGRDTTVFQCTPAPISIAAGCTDPNGNLSTCLLISSPPGSSYSGGNITFTPTASGTYTFILKATDACGLTDLDTSVAIVTLNSPPNIAFGNDTTLVQCTAAPICISYTVSDPNGFSGLIETLVSGPGSIDTLNNKVCFTPVAGGSYTIIAKVTDACGVIDQDTVVVNVTLNSPPNIAFGNDTTLVQCTAAPICVSYTVSDPNGFTGLIETLVSGPGSIDTLNNKVCFTPTASGSYTIIAKVTDACSVIDQDTVVVNVTLNSPPNFAFGNDTTLVQCTAAPICVSYTVSDPNGFTGLIEALVSGPGSIDTLNNKVCFTPAASGSYAIIAKVTDACGVIGQDTVVINVTLNQAPVANAGRDSTLFQCTAAPIGFAAGCTDPDGNLSTCQLTSGTGTYSGGSITFTPTGSGAYTFILKATDACGLTDYDTSVVNVTANQAPFANAGRDSTLFQCTAAPICIAAACSDPDGNLSTCQLVSGPGTYNGSGICFTPTASGTYTFVLKATDACGLTDYDTSVVNVTLNQAPFANAGRDSTLFQCTAAPISFAAGCTDPDGNLSTCQLTSGTGTYSGGGITFTPTASGTYTFILKATDACGLTDYDTSVVNVTLNQAPFANAGRDSTLFQCTAAPISFAAGCTDPDGNLSTCQLTSGTGTYSGGSITFTPTGSGTYTFIMKATDACGLTDYDTSVVNVTANQAPVATAGRDSTLFQCTAAPICIAAACSDPDGNLSTCQLVSGPGTYNGSGICFTPTASGTYTFVLKATDACGLTDYDTSVVNVTLNQAPFANAGRDSTLFQCTPTAISFAAGCTDPDGNLSTCQLTSGTGTYSGGSITFTPTGSGAYTFILKATDACGLTDYDTSVVNVTLNQAPFANAGRDSTLFQCTPAPISFAAGCTDPDGNLSTCQLTSGTGTYSGGSITFTPTGSGAYTFILKATDACGLTNYDTSVVNVTANQAPFANAGRDSTLFQCTPAPICIAAACSDPDGNLSTCQLVSGPGTYNGSGICFTPTASGAYTFVLKATDACGLTDYDTSVVNVTLNQAPFANAGRDSTLFQCTPAPICIAAACSDPDGNLSTCQLVSGPGTYNGSGICFTPAASGAYTFVLKATDACGLTDYDTSVVNVTANQAPFANAGRDSTLFQCTPAPICIAAACSDPDGNLSTCQLVSGPGTYNGSGICFTPTASGAYTFVLKATDACGLTDYDTSVVNVTLNQAPFANAGRDSTLFQCTPVPISFAAGCTDPDGNLSTCQLTSGTGTYSGGSITFTPTGGGIYTFILKATDACGLTDYDTSVVNVTINRPPVADAGRDSTLFQCTPAPISIAAGCSDPDVEPLVSRLSTCELISGTGTYSGGFITFTPTGSGGTYTFILKATDGCGLTDFDTSVVNVTMNQPPVANAGRDSTLFQCAPAPICIAAACSDPDGNLSTCQLVSGPGTFNGTNICFTPTAAGAYTLVLKATDACGAIDYDTAVVNVILNRAPLANAGRDSTVFVCALQPICWTTGCSDPDGNLATCQLVSGPGTLTGNQLCFTPAASGAYVFVVKATDACGLTGFDTSIVNVTMNSAPVANAGPDQNLTCQTPGQPICWSAGCTDPNNNLTKCELVSSTGTYDGSQICFTPTSSGSFSFVLRATDACGATDFDTAVVNVRVNNAPVLTVDPSDTTVFCMQTGARQVCVPFSYSDPDNNLKRITVSGSLTATINYASGNGLFCFTPPSSNGVYNFTVTAEDSCGLTTQGGHYHNVTLVDCDTATCFTVKIEKTHNTLQGHYETVSVTIEGADSEFGGFDFLLAYDASALTAVDVVPGELLTACGWEYFTYRFGPFGNCNGSCPSGLLRVVALADINNGGNHPSCFGPATSTPEELFKIKYLVTNDRTFSCQYVPVTFYWTDCGDNGISSVSGDTLYIDKRIYSFEGQLRWDELNDTQFPDYLRPAGMGAPDECMLGDKYHPLRCIEFWEGGIDIVCADSIDARGDVNLNGIANEIADAVLYTNYFLYGISAFDADAQRREAQIAASDVNADGKTLTVGDLVYLIRVIIGDALPYAKLAPFSQSVNVRFDGTVLSTESSVNLGALLLTFKVGDNCQVTNLTEMSLVQSVVNGELRVLVYDISSKSIGAGLSNVVGIKGDAELIKAEVADYNGNLLTTKLQVAAVPTHFALNQNYPNPFNPETIIEFALSAPTEMTLRVYNMTGQTVATLVSGLMPAGYHQVTWNGKDADGNVVSSGVYLYRIDSKNFSDTRKMLLIK